NHPECHDARPKTLCDHSINITVAGVHRDDTGIFGTTGHPRTRFRVRVFTRLIALSLQRAQGRPGLG
ncbi:hypothetical protein, partial [Bradyrhizobium sp. SZCCHNS3051]|uniref:hypothetical protein n=1 Tax=Bradyrhizobium sp. SZCCHNS3051 TaxID=3057320 RepID=UPI0029168728